jgi:hypothetical protein
VCLSIFGVCDLDDGTHWCSYDTWAGAQNQASKAVIKRHIRDAPVRRWLERVLLYEDGNRKHFLYVCLFPNEDRAEVFQSLFSKKGWNYHKTQKYWFCINPIDVQHVVLARLSDTPAYRDWTTPYKSHTAPGIDMTPGENPEVHIDPRENKEDENQSLTPGIDMDLGVQNPPNPGDQNDPLSLLKEQESNSVCVEYIEDRCTDTHTQNSFSCSLNENNQCIQTEPLQEDGVLLDWLLKSSNLEQAEAEQLLEPLLRSYRGLNQMTYRKRLAEIFNGKTLDQQGIVNRLQVHMTSAGVTKLDEEQANSLLTGTFLYLNLGEQWSVHCNVDNVQAKKVLKTIPQLAACIQMVDSWRAFGSWVAIRNELYGQLSGQCAKMPWTKQNFNIAENFGKVWSWMSVDFGNKQTARREEHGVDSVPTRTSEQIENILSRFVPMDRATASGARMMSIPATHPLPQQYWLLGMEDRVLGRLNAEEARLIGWVGSIPAKLNEAA